MFAGMAAAGGLLLLAEPEHMKTAVTILTTGAFAGYFITSHLTRDLVEKADSRKSAHSFEIHLSLAPDARVKRYRGLPQFTEYSIRPLTVSF
jgi:hypothetical protein